MSIVVACQDYLPWISVINLDFIQRTLPQTASPSALHLPGALLQLRHVQLIVVKLVILTDHRACRDGGTYLSVSGHFYTRLRSPEKTAKSRCVLTFYSAFSLRHKSDWKCCRVHARWLGGGVTHWQIDQAWMRTRTPFVVLPQGVNYSFLHMVYIHRCGGSLVATFVFVGWAARGSACLS